MSQSTGIEWTEATWNPWYGCTKVSPGCARCYMYREIRQYGRDPEVVTRSKTTFRQPLLWRAQPRLIFTCSWSDWFHEAADPWREEAWEIVRHTPQHTYQILTKRAERIAGHLPKDWGDGYPNVWLGVSIENQRHADRAAVLCGVAARVRFVSAEPLLGPVDLTKLVTAAPAEYAGFGEVNRVTEIDALRGRWLTELGIEYGGGARIHWLIAGGESGPGFRPMQLDWARALRDQCVAAGVPYFLKQIGGWPDKRGGEAAVLDGRRWTEMPDAGRAP
jgi:protein gp37